MRVSWLISWAFFWQGVFSDIIIERRIHQGEVERFEDTVAWFGPDLPEAGLVGVVQVANPRRGCSPIVGPPKNVNLINLHWIVIIERGHCNIQAKVEHAFQANYSAVIFYDDTGDIFEKSKLTESEHRNLRASNIPSVFIGQHDGRKIIKNYTFKNKNYEVRLTHETDFISSVYLIPFGFVIAICFFFVVVHHVRRQRRHRLSESSLKNIPIKTMEPMDVVRYETCCICLDNYVLKDKLRILPCTHAYHAKCIDPWLLKGKRVCPQCRKKVSVAGGVESEESEDERAPLLRGGASRNASNSTFAPQDENPFVLANRRLASGDTTNDEEEELMGNRLLPVVHVEHERGMAMEMNQSV